MPRKLLTFASVVSLLLFVAVWVLWARSKFAPVRLAFFSGQACYYTIDCDGGGLVFEKEAVRAVSTFITRPTPARFLGFGFTNAPATVQANPRLYPGSAAVPTPYRYAKIPYWFLAALTLLLPAIRAARQRKVGPGCCRTCGYDLRASPGKCPECGTAPDAQAKTAA